MDIAQLEKLIEEGNLKAVTALLSSQPALSEKATSQGVSPLLLAAYYKKPAIASAIAGYVTRLSIHEAAAIGNLEQVGAILADDPEMVNRYSEDGFTPVALASFFEHETVVGYLIRNGADINLPANNGYNVYPIHSACAANNLNIVSTLLTAGADVNVKQMAGVTPLHAAAEHGNIDMIILLLEYGAVTDVRMEGGKLPADLADERGFAEIARILRE